MPKEAKMQVKYAIGLPMDMVGRGVEFGMAEARSINIHSPQNFDIVF